MKFSPKIRNSILSVIFLGFFLVLNLTAFNKEFKNFFYLVSEPIQKFLWQAGSEVSDFFGTIWEMKILKEENESLRQKNQELLSEIVSLKELKKENEFLRTSLNIGLEKEFQLMIARVISKDISQDSLLIDKGLKDGITKGLPIITNQKALLGRIGEVYKDFSEIILISNKESSFDAKGSEEDIYGIVKGKGNFKLFLDLIPKEKEIFEGNLIITSALGGVFPDGLLVGEIKKIKKSDIEPFQTAEIKPNFDLKELDYLFIITNF